MVAVRVLHDKSTYNQLELPSGRMAQVKRGDIVAGALGHRHALFGYAGHLPTSLAPGDRIHLLNMGGVLGICDSVSPDLGPPFECEVLGAVLHFPYLGERIGVAARIGGLPLDADAPVMTGGVPVVALVGSCMNCGKTAAACALVRELSHGGLTVDGFKATGVSLRRDVLAMEDAGARTTAIFTDLGVVTTTAANAASVTRTLLTRLAANRPDAIVAELGDGLLGAYGVAAILEDEKIRKAFTAVVLAANDPVAAWGGVRMLRERFGIEPAAVTGPATDNLAGTRIIEEQLGVPAINARLDAAPADGADPGAAAGARGGRGRDPCRRAGRLGVCGRRAAAAPRGPSPSAPGGHPLGEPGGGAGRVGLSPPGRLLSRAEVLRAGRAVRRIGGTGGGVLRRAAWRRRGSPGRGARRGGAEGAGGPCRGPLGRFPFRRCRRVRAGLWPCPWRARRGWPPSTAPCPSTPNGTSDQGSHRPTRGASPPPRCWRPCRCSSSGWSSRG